MILQAGHHARHKTNSPIFGILMQPMPSAWLHHPQLKKRDGSNQFYTRYFESSHAEFLMAGGARVVPIDYRLEEKVLVNLLE